MSPNERIIALLEIAGANGVDEAMIGEICNVSSVTLLPALAKLERTEKVFSKPHETQRGKRVYRINMMQ